MCFKCCNSFCCSFHKYPIWDSKTAHKELRGYPKLFCSSGYGFMRRIVDVELFSEKTRSTTVYVVKWKSGIKYTKIKVFHIHGEILNNFTSASCLYPDNPWCFTVGNEQLNWNPVLWARVRDQRNFNQMFIELIQANTFLAFLSCCYKSRYETRDDDPGRVWAARFHFTATLEANGKIATCRHLLRWYNRSSNGNNRVLHQHLTNPRNTERKSSKK